MISHYSSFDLAALGHWSSSSWDQRCWFESRFCFEWSNCHCPSRRWLSRKPGRDRTDRCAARRRRKQATLKCELDTKKIIVLNGPSITSFLSLILSFQSTVQFHKNFNVGNCNSGVEVLSTFQSLAANIAPWFRLCLPSCGHGFKSQAHHAMLFQFVFLKL